MPHAYWLMTCPERDRSKCTCKYCGKSSQRRINEELGCVPRPAERASTSKFIVIEATDADPSRWPENTVSRADAEGNVNFMRPVPVQHEVALKWRVVIGQALAKMLNYPDAGAKRHSHRLIESLLRIVGIDSTWVLKEWPTHYHLYDHNKGQPGGAVRHDLYLIGELSWSIVSSEPYRAFSLRLYKRFTIPFASRIRSTCVLAYNQFSGKPCKLPLQVLQGRKT